MSQQWPHIPPDGDDITRLEQFEALLRRLSAQPGSQCGLCNGTFSAGEHATLLLCGHIIHVDCVSERQPEQKCPHCNDRILPWHILPVPQTPPGPPPSTPPGSSGAPVGRPSSV